MTTDRQTSWRRAWRSGEPFPSGHRRQLAPRHVVHRPFLVLREVVEAEDTRVFAAVVDGLLDDLCLLDAHRAGP